MEVVQQSRSKRAEKKKEADGKKAKLLGDKLGLDKQKAADTLKRYTFLLGQTDIFQHFIKQDGRDTLLSPTSEAKEKTDASRRHRKAEDEEDAELLTQDNTESEVQLVFTDSPPYVRGTMRNYQVHGLNWMISLFENGVNGVLADEMGLGKTLQTISFLGYLKFHRNTSGPHLVVVPKTTLHNWQNEFKMWIPEFNVLLFHGDQARRTELVQQRLLSLDFDVCIASYEMCLLEKTHMKKISWSYIVVDEAHRIKNESSQLSQIVRLFNCRNRLLLTGTPLQNNLHELWALLNFLLPDVFSEASDFETWFEDGTQDKVQQLHKVLRPFMLRRIKAEVEKTLLPKKRVNIYVNLSAMQKIWYKRILEKNIDAVNGPTGKSKANRTRLLNIVMQLRKCCNHPYLFDGTEPGPPYTTDHHLVDNAGKMMVLDKLLFRLKEQGSRVLLFSQMTRVLDILEDYCVWRNFGYCRIDGNTPHEERVRSIDEYNSPGSSKFLFLLTTRAGGLGINLTTADIVIMYDNDWNPQVDLQAEDRAHRIGQTKQVYAYRFVTENTIEEKVIERATQKLQLDKMVIQNGRLAQPTKDSSDDYLTMIRHGAAALFQNTDASGNGLDNDGGGDSDTGRPGVESEIQDNQNKHSNSVGDTTKSKKVPKGKGKMNTMDVDEILRRSEAKTAELAKKYDNANIEDLLHLGGSAYEWGGEDYRKRHEKDDWGRLKFGWIGPSKRERKANYGIDDYYRTTLGISGKRDMAAKKLKQLSMPDHQFFPPRYHDLVNQAVYCEWNQLNYQIPRRTPAPGEKITEEELETERQEEQLKLDNALPLTEEEELEKAKLYKSGFSQWTKRDFGAFLKASEKHGRYQVEAIAEEIGSKSVENVQEYSDVFWTRYRELADWEKKISDIEKGEEKLQRTTSMQNWLDAQLSKCDDPLYQLKVAYTAKTRSKQYTEYEDRFLLVSMTQHGLLADDLYEGIRRDVLLQPRFRFDWFLKSRTASEIQRRCATLLSLVQKEMDSVNGIDAASSQSIGKKRLMTDESLAPLPIPVEIKKRKTN